MTIQLPALATIWGKLRRTRNPDRLFTLAPLDRDTWDPWPDEWSAFYTDAVKAAGDRACLEVLERQRIRDERFPNRARHAAGDPLLSNTDVFLQLTSSWGTGDWRCLHCAAGEHELCPACSCPCSLMEVAV